MNKNVIPDPLPPEPVPIRKRAPRQSRTLEASQTALAWAKDMLEPEYDDIWELAQRLDKAAQETLKAFLASKHEPPRQD